MAADGVEPLPAGAADQPLDPYLIWAACTQYRGLSLRTGEGGERRLTFVTKKKAATDPGWMDGYSLFELTPEKATQLLCAGKLSAELAVPRRVREDSFLEPFESVNQPKLKGSPVLAVIDYGFSFGHESFRAWNPKSQHWDSRIAAIWDQSFEAGPTAPWRPAKPYGRTVGSKEINSWLNASTHGGVVNEDDFYQRASYTQASSSLAHGTHVLHLAGGRTTVEDAASKAPVVLVQLPRPTVEDTSGASMTAQVLAALAYIDAQVDIDTPLVVNLSYAAASGPHQGTTFLEQAMDDFIAKRSTTASTAITLPAGNGYESDSHAQVTLTTSRPRVELEWLVRADDPTDSFIELWYPTPSCGSLTISLRSPHGMLLGPAGADELRRDKDRAGIVHRKKSLFDAERSVCLVALAPTISHAPVRASPGIWTVLLEWKAPDGATVTVDAWIQRDDASLGLPWRTRQSRFVSTSPPGDRTQDDANDPVQRIGTSNGFSHGKKSLVVGGRYADGGLTRYTAAALPNVAPKRDSHSWPDVLAPSETSRVLGGIPSIGTRGSATKRMNGTSVAAPQVARMLINIFAESPRTPRPPSRGEQNSQPVSPAQSLLQRIAKPHEGAEAPSADKYRRGWGNLLKPDQDPTPDPESAVESTQPLGDTAETP